MTTTRDVVASLKLCTDNERDPEHLQVRGEVESVRGDEAVKVTVCPLDTLHGTGAPHVGLHCSLSSL